MNRKFLTVVITVVAIVSLQGCQQKIESREAAVSAINDLVADKIRPGTRENRVRANISLTDTNLLSLLPDLNEYPIVVGRQDSSQIEAVEIFTSSEKAGRERDGFYLELADAFNSERITLSNGKQAAVAIRKMPSGLGASFMLAGAYTPDAFSPSNHLWGDMLKAEGIRIDTVAEVTAPNTAGIVVKKSSIDQITTNNQLDIQKLLTNVTNGDFSMGYTNPYQSSTGLNFLVTILHAFARGDESKMLSPDVASAFEAFQSGVPFVAQTTLQMRDAAQNSGVLDAMVMEHQTWVNVRGMSEYTFIPFGVRHDSPLYATPEANDAEREVLDLFATFISQNRKNAGVFGFGKQPDYEAAYSIEDGKVLTSAQKLWKQRKTGGRSVAAVFVADVSGSMDDGARLINLKKALVESADLISSNNSIGLVTFNEYVNIDLPIREFDVQNKSLFVGAVQGLTAGGRTATNNAVVVATKMLSDYAVSHPDHKLVVFVLSDGEQNEGFELAKVQDALQWSGVPVHTIAYDIQSEQLKSLSRLAEGAYIESSSTSASYRIGNLLNSEM